MSGERRDGLPCGPTLCGGELGSLPRRECSRREVGAGHADQAHFVGVLGFMRMAARRRMGDDQQDGRSESDL